MSVRRTRKGGRSRAGGSRRRRGGTMRSVLRKAAVPAALLWANTMYRTGTPGRLLKRDLGVELGRRRRRRTARRKKRRGRTGRRRRR